MVDEREDCSIKEERIVPERKLLVIKEEYEGGKLCYQFSRLQPYTFLLGELTVKGFNKQSLALKYDLLEVEYKAGIY